MVYRLPEHLEQMVSHLCDTPRDLTEKAKTISPN